MIGASCVAVVGLVLAGSPVRIELRGEVFSERPSIRLADVATLVGDAEATTRFAAVPLIVAPADDSSVKLTRAGLRELLAVQGISSADFVLTGAAETIVYPPYRARLPAPREEAPPVAQDEPLRTSTTPAGLVEQAVAAYLAERTGEAGWKVQATVPLQCQSALAAIRRREPSGESEARPASVETPSAPFRVEGGRTPWLGLQSFVVAVGDARQERKFTITAQVARTLPTLVTTRALRRGEVVSDRDIVVRRIERSADGGAVEPRDVVGLETTRALAAGEPLDLRAVQRPVLVQKNEVVTVVARAPGVQVKTSAKVLDAGSHGDLVTVGTLDNKQRFTARVVGLQEVEVYAAGPVAR